MADLDHFDVCIVGAGVVGLAAAHKIAAHPAFANRSIVLLEKNRRFGEETSSRNSEVIHAGIYYPPGSLKARLCVDGKQQLYAWCRSRDIPFRQTGKLIIAGGGQEEDLAAIDRQARLNGVDDLQPLDRRALLALEPELAAGSALLSPSSGIIDSHAFMLSLFHQAQVDGVVFSPLTRVTQIQRHDRGYAVGCQCQDSPYRFTCENLVNAAGLHTQALAGCIADFPAAAVPPPQWVKGSYFTLQGKSPFSHLVYPVPEKNLRGLGIHLTLDLAGQAKFGPDTETVDSLDYAVSAGKEAGFRAAIARYYPGITGQGLRPAYSGIRPKLDSRGIADFVVQDGAAHGFAGLVQLFGIESPGLTASLALGDEILALLRH